MTALQTLRGRDPGLAALRRSCRAGITASGLFALCVQVLGNETAGIFAAFGSIALLIFVDFTGPVPDRLATQFSLVMVGAALVCLGTVASQNVWVATAAMAVTAFAILFSGIVSSVIASASTALLVSFILPVTLPGPVSSLPDRLAGWFMAGAASMVAVTVLWPTPTREPLRPATAHACTALARQLRAEVDCVQSGFPADRRERLHTLVDTANTAVTALRSSFFATPYRPTGLSTATRVLVRLVDEVLWLQSILQRTPLAEQPGRADAEVCEVKLAAADLLEHGAHLLESDESRTVLAADLARLQQNCSLMTRAVTTSLQAPATDPPPEATSLLNSLEPGFRAQEMSIAITAIAANIERTVAARRRPWHQRLLGRQATGLPASVTSLQERAGAHVGHHSVWLHNSVRGALGLGLAVFVAEIVGVQHSFWVAFGTMAVLRSNAVLTGQNAVRAILGTVVGIIVGSALILAVDTNTTVFWVLLAPAIVFTGLAPATISFAAGQAGFTATLLILFNILNPTGWAIGLVRVEDVAIGCAVSVAVAALFWPRGAGAALGTALAGALAESTRYLRHAIEYGVVNSDTDPPHASEPDQERRRAAAAARRLDDAFRGFVTERGTKHLALADVTTLVTAVALLRLTADAVVDLWRKQQPRPGGSVAARTELLRAAVLLADWYERTAQALAGYGTVPELLAHDGSSDDRLVTAVRGDLLGDDGRSTDVAVRMIWTADHIAVVERLQASVREPARAAADLQFQSSTKAAFWRPGPRVTRG